MGMAVLIVMVTGMLVMSIMGWGVVVAMAVAICFFFFVCMMMRGF